MTISVEVRSSGWGPRWCGMWTGFRSQDASMLVKGLARFLRDAWPRDGVAITIRREP